MNSENSSALDFGSMGFYSDETLYPEPIKVGAIEGIVHVRKLPVVELRRFQMETESPDQGVRERAGLSALVRSIRREDGTPHMTIEQAKKLKGEAVKELMRVFVKVNAPKEDADLGNA